MTPSRWLCLLLSALILAGCASPSPAPSAPSTVPVPTTAPTVPTAAAETVPATTVPAVVPELSEEDQALLLKIGMAELGSTQCETCIALVMCTVLNRVASPRFGSTVSSVILAPGQFTPVSDGTFDSAQPNDACYAALDQVLRGWDESQGALYYEFCDGPSWHSQNLQLLTHHCNTRFYAG